MENIIINATIDNECDREIIVSHIEKCNKNNWIKIDY